MTSSDENLNANPPALEGKIFVSDGLSGLFHDAGCERQFQKAVDWAFAQLRDAPIGEFRVVEVRKLPKEAAAELPTRLLALKGDMVIVRKIPLSIADAVANLIRNNHQLRSQFEHALTTTLSALMDRDLDSLAISIGRKPHCSNLRIRRALHNPNWFEVVQS